MARKRKAHMTELRKSQALRGAKARRNGYGRDACPFKSIQPRVAWISGWIAEDKVIDEEERQAAVPRWLDRKRDSLLCGSVRTVTIHGRFGVAGLHVSSDACGIANVCLNTADMDEAKVLGIQLVHATMRQNLDELEAAAVVLGVELHGSKQATLGGAK
jgi:ribosome modulation factor